MNATFYRLGEYKIIESASGELTWETHFGFGVLQEGRCFRKGSILFIGPAENQRLGLLKGEFLDQLNSLPAWSKTNYYCRGVDVHHCQSGKRVAREEMELWRLEPGIGEGQRCNSKRTGQQSDRSAPTNAAGESACRLQGYEITKKSNGQLAWKKYTGAHSVSSGECSLVEDVLFIGSGHSAQSTVNKRQFLADLELLPTWDQTKYYCTNLSLHDCAPRNGLHEAKESSFRESKGAVRDEAGKEYRERIKLKLKQLSMPGKRFQLHSRFLKKWSAYAAALLLYLITALFRQLVRCCKDLAERWHRRRNSRRW